MATRVPGRWRDSPRLLATGGPRHRHPGGARAALALALLALFAPAAARAGELAERAAAIDAPRRGPAVAVNSPLRVGRASITPGAGTRVYPLVADGRACGLLVDGPARLVYRVEDRFSRPVAERNLRRTSALAPVPEADALTVGAELAGAVVWGWDLLPAAGDAPGGGPSLPEWAAKVVAGRRFSPPSHDLLAAEANGNGGLRYALLRAPRETLLLHVDPAAGEENLFRLERMSDPGASLRQGVRADALAAQPIGRAWWERPARPLVAVHQALRVDNPGGDRLALVSRSRLRADRPAVRLWQAQLVDRIYDPAGPTRVLTVRGVRVDGRPADFLHRDDQLLVTLGRAVGRGETVEVEVTYDGDIAHRPSGNSYWLLGTWPWYPRQEFDGEHATMEIAVEVPAELTPFASGAEVGRSEQNGRRRVATRLDRPMQFAVVIAGKYQLVEATRADVTARAATYAMLKEKPARQLLEKFYLGIGFFEQLFGEPYPFRNFTIVELADWGFGQAPPGIIFFTKEFYTAPVERRRRVYFQDLDSRFLHEIAHGWWAHVVKMESPEEAWLSEAFADYTAALALWRTRGERGEYMFSEIVQEWQRGAADVAPGGSLFLAHRLALSDDRNREDLWRLRYAKGPLVLHALRLELQRQMGGAGEGDSYFIELLRRYMQRNRYGYGTTRSLVATLNELTGGDWQPWFERYVYGTETPSVRQPPAAAPAAAAAPASDEPRP